MDPNDLRDCVEREIKKLIEPVGWERCEVVKAEQESLRSILAKRDSDANRGGGGSGGEPPAIDPIIGGLLKRLPKTGDVWPEADRKLWLQLLERQLQADLQG
jgi:hypothetical protein